MWRVIDLGGTGYFLHTAHNKLIIEREEEEAQIPFEDIHSIICHGLGFRYSDAFFKSCLSHKVPVTFCDEKHIPQGMLLPMLQHKESSQRVDLQLKASLPRRKQAWQQIVTQKLKNQRDFLEFLKVPGVKRLDVLSQTVLSGDPRNNEAQGAKVYFESMYGSGFFRSDEDNAINGKLDYGYSILRSAVARAVVDTGLLPSCGVFHSSRINPFCLVDDLMEPFRPLVDSLVFAMCAKHGIVKELEPHEKRVLMSLTGREVVFDEQDVEFSYALRLYVLSYLGFLARTRDSIQFPTYAYAWSV